MLVKIDSAAWRFLLKGGSYRENAKIVLNSLEFWRQWMLDPFFFSIILGMVHSFRRAVDGLVWGISQPIVTLRRGKKCSHSTWLETARRWKNCLLQADWTLVNSLLKSWGLSVWYFLPTFFFLYFLSTCVLLASLLSLPLPYIHKYILT